MKTDITVFSDFMLCTIAADSIEDVPYAEDNKYYRVEVPSKPNNIVEMDKKGYVLVDRTIGVSIPLRKNDIDYQKLIRFDVRKATPNDKELISNIALTSFPYDRRFHIRPTTDDSMAETIIRKWIEDLSEVFVCVHKEAVVGFLDLESYDEMGKFIYLAAVQERYRAAGAAVSLYANVIQNLKENGNEKVYGRISSANTAVMNLYARLGGLFSNPLDIFVRDEDEFRSVI